MDLERFKYFDSISEDVRERLKEIPRGNSLFQELAFVVNPEITPERAYRQILAQMQRYLKALEANKFSMQRALIDIEELKEKEPVNKFDARRIKLDIEEKELQLRQDQDLIDDAEYSVNFLNYLLEQFPRFNREQFEAAELEYFTNKLEPESKDHRFALEFEKGFKEIIQQAHENSSFIHPKPLPLQFGQNKLGI